LRGLFRFAELLRCAKLAELAPASARSARQIRAR